jgi:DnaJ domain
MTGMKASTLKRSWRLGEDCSERPTAPRHCDHPGCAGDGEFRAPRARDRLNEYYWFCLTHVRAYNAAWNYYAGMSPEEIERDLRRDTTWQRPTWPLGGKTGKGRFSFTMHDPFDIFEDDGEGGAPTKTRTPEAEAMRVLDLEGELTLAILKARYKELVKLHHPDANGGDKEAEEKFKQINQAYTTLRNFLNT